MFRLTLKNLRAHKRRLVATCFAVLLGVSFLSGTLATGDTMRAGFGQVITQLTAGTDAVVRSTTDIGDDESASEQGLLDQSLAAELSRVDGVRLAVADAEGSGQIIGADGRRIGGGGPPTIAASWIDDEALAGYQIDSGRAPTTGDEVVIDKRAAGEGHLHVGDRVTILVPDAVEFTLVGIMKFQRYDSISGATFAAFTPERASELLLGQPGKATEIYVAADPGVSEQQVVDGIRPLLPDSVEAVTGAQVEAEFKQSIEDDFLGFFEMFLLVFAGVALLVAMFSIYNTFSIIVAQRTRESALLRALGASKRQVLRSITLEASFVGLLASGLGLAVGIGLAHGMAALLEGQDVELPAGVVVDTSTTVISMCIGVGVTLLASVAPAVRASRVAPLAALREVAVERVGRSVVRAAFGVLFATGGVVLVLAGANGGELPVAGLGAVGALVGMVLLGPVVARPVAGILGAPVGALRGSAGRLARRNAMRNPKRTAASASALLVGVAVVTVFTVYGASIKESIAQTANRNVRADLVVSDESISGIGMSPSLADDISKLPQVKDAVNAAEGVAVIGGDTVYPMVVDIAAMPDIADMEVERGTLESVGPRGLAVGSDRAKDTGWELGSQVPVSFADGTTETFTVEAIYDLDNLFGDLLMNRTDYAPHATQLTDVVTLLTVADGTSIDGAKAAVQTVVDRYYGPDVLTRDGYLDLVNQQVDQMLIVVYALLGLAIVIAVMGIANTISLAVHERTRELGLLRAVGQTRRQTRTMVRWESVMTALFGTIGGIVLGTFLGWGVVKSIGESEGIGTFALPVQPLVIVLVLGAAAGVVAAMRPARRAAKLDVLTAIAS
jgi:putative ABC transport system permease protein